MYVNAYLLDFIKYVLFREIKRILHAGWVNPCVRWTRELLHNAILHYVPHTVEIHPGRGGEVPGRRYDGAENTIVHVRQRPVFILNEVCKWTLRGLQNSESL